MDIDAELERLDGEIEAAEIDLIHRRAQLAGLRAQREALSNDLALVAGRASTRNQAVGRVDLRAMDRTDAIVVVLAEAGTDLSIQDVWDGLVAGGREEPDYQVIASTLNFLRQKERIRRTGRGRYAA